MSSFHPETIRLLQGSLLKHTAELDLARIDLAKAQQDVDEKAAIVADCVRFLNFAELCDRDEDLAHAFADAVLNRDGETADATANPNFAVGSGIYTSAQFDGEDCAVCGIFIADGQASVPVGSVLDAGQLLAHRSCAGTGDSRQVSAHVDICGEVTK